MAPGRALPPALVASALWYAALVSVGSAFGLEWEDVRHLVGEANRVLAVLAALAVTALAIWIARRARRSP
ncbi:MAG: hypothetical protein R3362_09700 [Rhodothermales bacterium]|nr:hypothetical protein [Rhodothermales bacterium]